MRTEIWSFLPENLNFDPFFAVINGSNLKILEKRTESRPAYAYTDRSRLEIWKMNILTFLRTETAQDDGRGGEHQQNNLPNDHQHIVPEKRKSKKFVTKKIQTQSSSSKRP